MLPNANLVKESLFFVMKSRSHTLQDVRWNVSTEICFINHQSLVIFTFPFYFLTSSTTYDFMTPNWIYKISKYGLHSFSRLDLLAMLRIALFRPRRGLKPSICYKQKALCRCKFSRMLYRFKALIVHIVGYSY